MAVGYNHFGLGTADIVTDDAGNVIATTTGGQPITATVWDDETAGVQVTDLLDEADAPLPGYVPAQQAAGVDRGRMAFQAPDSYSVLFLDFGQGRRWAVTARESLVRLGTAIARSDEALARADEALATRIPNDEKGAPSGVATLDAGGHVPQVQIPDLSATYAAKSAANVFTAQQTVPGIRLTEQADAIIITDALGTNGRRVSIQPIDQLASTKSAQLELIPGAAVDQGTETTAQILLFGKTGTDYERLLVDARLGEFRVVTSKRNAGTQRPIVFYYEDNGVSLAPIASFRTDGNVRVMNALQFGSAGDASLSRTAAGILTTPGQFIANSTVRAGSGTTQEVRLGNAAGLGVAAINFGDLQDAYIARIGVGHLRTNGKFEIDGDLDHDGTNVGFYGVAPVPRATALTAADASAVNSGDATTDTVINNIRTRLNEAETKLKALGLFQ